MLEAKVLYKNVKTTTTKYVLLFLPNQGRSHSEVAVTKFFPRSTVTIALKIPQIVPPVNLQVATMLHLLISIRNVYSATLA